MLRSGSPCKWWHQFFADTRIYPREVQARTRFAPSSRSSERGCPDASVESVASSRRKSGRKSGSFFARAGAAVLAAILCLSSIGYGEPANIPDLINLSIEQLGNIEITSVSRRRERL